MPSVKPFDVGLLVGRFQLFHKGHEHLVEKALKLCDRLLIFVGSAQEMGTPLNPFDVGTRMNLISEIFGDVVIVRPLSDFSTPDDVSEAWAKYLLEATKQQIFKLPDLLVYGEDDERDNWFKPSPFDRYACTKFDVPFSATKGRKLMVANDIEEWMKRHNPKAHKHFPQYRQQLMTIPFYQNMFKEMFPKKLEGWKDYSI